MKKVLIGSQNPIKIACTKEAFQKAFPEDTFEFIGMNSPSNVSDQPMSDYETYQGAMNRALHLKANSPGIDYYVGIEGGIGYHDKDMEAFAWVVILSSTDQIGKARTGSFVLPKKIQFLIEDGVELGEADDIVFGRKNSKQQNGAVGLLTNDLITRSAYYEQAVILAIIPFFKPDLWIN